MDDLTEALNDSMREVELEVDQMLIHEHQLYVQFVYLELKERELDQYIIYMLGSPLTLDNQVLITVAVAIRVKLRAKLFDVAQRLVDCWAGIDGMHVALVETNHDLFG